MYPDIRFTDYHPFKFEGKGKFIEIILKDGESYSLSQGGRTEEGWNREDVTYTYEDGVITCYSHSDGVDCDGRLEQFSEYSTTPEHLTDRRARLYQRKKPHGKDWETVDCYSRTIKIPEWSNAKRSQRDYTAESMGY